MRGHENAGPLGSCRMDTLQDTFPYWFQSMQAAFVETVTI
jgi:hypothetical protein